MRLTIGAFCCVVLLSGSAWAATLEPSQGSLTVNQGDGFHPVNSRVDAKVGDSAMVAPGGSASLVYDDGCTVTIQPGEVTTIAPISPCASGSYAQGNNDNSSTDVATTTGMLAVVGGTVAGIVYVGSQTSGHSASP